LYFRQAFPLSLKYEKTIGKGGEDSYGGRKSYEGKIDEMRDAELF
jgi:hypothetical protein